MTARATPVRTEVDLERRFRTMATDATIRVVGPRPGAERAVEEAIATFAQVERTCTRFDPSSPLMLANEAATSWHVVPQECFAAIEEAARAHEMTDGRFDPRTLRTLQAWGYDRSLPFEADTVALPQARQQARGPATLPGASQVVVDLTGRRPRWRPGFDATALAVKVGPQPVDLGGIGKGLAVRWAMERLAQAGDAVLVDAGGDCYLAGPGPDGDGWQVAVEDPQGGAAPLAVLSLRDAACATSSVRVRRWTVGGRRVHHLIDPATGAPGGKGLLAVTVVHADPADAEVWSKALFFEGASGIARLAQRQGLAALWVGEDGEVGTSEPLRPLVIWQAPRG